jgi:hypothetical protein
MKRPESQQMTEQERLIHEIRERLENTPKAGNSSPESTFCSNASRTDSDIFGDASSISVRQLTAR